MGDRLILGLGLSLLVVGCGGGGTPPADGGGVDAMGAGDGSSDLGHDASARCTSDPDCSDGVYCNGVEGCSPGATGADARGCVMATMSPCLAGQTCDESMDRCNTTTCTGTAGDADGDGHRATSCGGDDCDDADPNRYPGNHEVCDMTNHDEDCDTNSFGFRDNDGDSFPDVNCCNMTATGTLNCGVDCNDANPSIHPTATEACNGLDDNCNGMTDEGVLHTYHADTDGDGFGTMDDTMTMMGCTPPLGYVENATDCDDTTAMISPAAPEVCDPAMADENCNGMHNEGCTCTGGSRMCVSAGACASGTETCIAGMWGSCSIAPVTETCNGIDDDCNGVVDNGVQITCYVDGDDDGFAAAGAAVVLECTDPARPTRGGCHSGSTNQRPVDVTTTDCNDAIVDVHPGAPETCNGRDDNCNTTIDEGVLTTFYADCDSDGHGTSATSGSSTCGPRTMSACTPPPGFVASNDDCDDSRANVFPGRVEDCDCIDNNCNGAMDEGVTAATYYRDGDGDMYGVMAGAMTTCCPAAGYINNANTMAMLWDCDDTNASIHPGAGVMCGIDANCSGMPGATTTWYADCDHDGYSPTAAPSMMTCTMPVTAPTGCPVGPPGTWQSTNPPMTAGLADCNDANNAIHPFAMELCNGIDDNCFKEPGHPIFGLGAPGEDGDDDGEAHCAGLTPYDCNDADPTVRHSATELVADGVDENCDGLETCYVDSDMDAYRTGATTSTSDIACASANGHALATAGSDCCDADSRARPLESLFYLTTDACGSFDYNCTAVIEKLYPTSSTGMCVDDGSGAGTCSATPTTGWIGAVPACGVSGMRNGGCTSAPICDCFPCTVASGCLSGHECVARSPVTTTETCH